MHEHHEHHEHGGQAVSTKEEALALLHYTLHHNEHHLSELTELADALDDASCRDSAARVRLAAARYAEGNALLDEALSLAEE